MFWWIFLFVLLVALTYLVVKSARAGYGKLLSAIVVWGLLVWYLVSFPSHDLTGRIFTHALIAWLLLGVPITLLTWWILVPLWRGR